ncbi:MAG: ACT domain-containing protein [Oscillospiraceae bacterium]|nr:ACT domain-containing protein [Oscillospiraceae bacterium]
MLENYLIVHKSVLPDYFEKVVEARRLVESGRAGDVSSAVKMAGISRSTYYKYKDYVLEPAAVSDGRKAVLSVMLAHETGVLSALLTKVSDAGCSVLTITQSLPIHDRAGVTISLDISDMPGTIDELMKSLSQTPGVENPKLLAIE